MISRINPIGMVLLAVVLVGWLALPVAAEWIQDGGALNLDPTSYALGPEVTAGNGTIYAAWGEWKSGSPQVIYVKHLVHGAWVQDGSAVSGDGQDPSLSVVQGTPFIAWASNGTNVARLENGQWLTEAAPLNITPGTNSRNPCLASDPNGMVYTVWSEYSASSIGQVYVKHRVSAGTWVQDGLALNVNQSRDTSNPSLAFIGDTPYVAWDEDFGGIFVKHLSGNNWVSDGGALNYISVFAGVSNPCLINHEGTLLAAFSETDGVNQVYVEHLSQGQWVLDGSRSLNLVPRNPADAPRMAVVKGVLLIVWSEITGTSAQIYVKHFSAETWAQDGGSLNVDPTKAANAPSITVLDGIPYVGWSESDGTKSTFYIKHFTGTFSSNPPTASGWSEILLKISPQVLRSSRGVTTRVTVYVPRPGNYDLSCYSLSGAKSSTLFHGWWETGTHEIDWDGSGSATGLHHILCEGEGQKAKAKIVIVR